MSVVEIRDVSKSSFYPAEYELQVTLRDYKVDNGEKMATSAKELAESRPYRMSFPQSSTDVDNQQQTKEAIHVDSQEDQNSQDVTEPDSSENVSLTVEDSANATIEDAMKTPTTKKTTEESAESIIIHKRRPRKVLSEIPTIFDDSELNSRKSKSKGPTMFAGQMFSTVSIDKCYLSTKHVDWVTPCYVPPPEVNENDDFIGDGPTPKKRKKFKDPYVVDKILGMMVDQAGEDLYFIRWFGYDDRTWEPFSNLDNCPGKLKEFRRDLRIMPKYELMRQRFFIDIDKFREKINKPWPNQNSGIEVVNEVDFTAPMLTFNYINKLQFPPNRELLPVGCGCEGGICDKKCECANKDGFKVPYNEDGTVNRFQNYPIYECNDSCTCDPAVCPYRVVQKGRKVKLQIFKTDNGRGWGVKALENIQKNQFVVEYMGEVISYEEADRRGKQYDARGRTYLFDMDLFEDECCSEKFTIDAKPYGNEARFINHACKPNLFTRAILWESVDQSIHHLALFAKRDIKIGEELSFSYNNSSLSKDTQYEANKNEGQVKCQCRKNCPNKLFK